MKSFKEFIAPNVLEEAVVKPGIVLSYSRKSKVSGDKAESAFLAGRAALKRGQAGESTSDRLKRLETCLDWSLIGHAHTRHQLGNLVAAVVAAQVMRRK